MEKYLTLIHPSKIEHDSVYSLKLSYYLQHHAAYKPDSTTSKLRIAFSASCPSSNDLSLNNALQTGPILKAVLTILIPRGRLFKFGYNANI